MKKSLLLLITLASAPCNQLLADCSRELAEDLTYILFDLARDHVNATITQSKLELETAAASDLKDILQPELTELDAIIEQVSATAWKLLEVKKELVINAVQKKIKDDKEANSLVDYWLLIRSDWQNMRSQGAQISVLQLPLLVSELDDEGRQRLSALALQLLELLMYDPEIINFILTNQSQIDKCHELAESIKAKIAATREQQA